MVQNSLILRHLIIHFPTSEGVSEVSEQSKQMSSASEKANEQASSPVLTSGFLIILAHSVMVKE